MHKELTSNIGRSEKIVFDEEDIPFFRGDHGYISKTDLAKHFKVSYDTIDNAINRQPELFKAYEESKEKQRKMHKETVVGYRYKTEKNVFDVEDIAEVERLAAYLSVEQIAAYFCISTNAFYEIMKRQPEVKENYQKGRVEKTILFAQQLQDKALGITTEGDTTCLLFYLKTRARWSEAVPETKIEDQIVLTPEQQEEKDKDVKLFTEFKKRKKEKGIE